MGQTYKLPEQTIGSRQHSALVASGSTTGTIGETHKLSDQAIGLTSDTAPIASQRTIREKLTGCQIMSWGSHQHSAPVASKEPPRRNSRAVGSGNRARISTQLSSQRWKHLGETHSLFDQTPGFPIVNYYRGESPSGGTIRGKT